MKKFLFVLGNEIALFLVTFLVALARMAEAVVPGKVSGATFRHRTCDVAYTYRMSAGFPGNTSRHHPSSVEPVLQNATHPIDAYGQGGIAEADGTIRKLIAADSAITDLYGISVRPTPIQQTTTVSDYGAAAIGDATPPSTGVLDMCRSGYIMVKLPAGGTPIKGQPVYMWIAADSGSHLQGGFEAAASVGNTIKLSNVVFNGGKDDSNTVEVFISPARNA